MHCTQTGLGWVNPKKTTKDRMNWACLLCWRDIQNQKKDWYRVQFSDGVHFCHPPEIYQGQKEKLEKAYESVRENLKRCLQKQHGLIWLRPSKILKLNIIQKPGMRYYCQDCIQEHNEPRPSRIKKKKKKTPSLLSGGWA